MVTKIEIRNFQSHRKTIIDLDKGVNVFVGQTEGGKTAIIRALRWLIYNRPSGNSFRSHWGGTTSVKVTLDDGNIIERIKSDKVNKYVLNGEDLKGFGTKVPEEVSEVLRIEDLNIQQQLDSHYLLSSSPGEVSNHFNRIAKIDGIGLLTKKANKRINETSKFINYQEEDLKSVKENLKNYEYLDKAEIELEQLEQLEKQKLTFARTKRSIQVLIDMYVEKQKEITDLEEFLKDEKFINDVLSLFEERRQVFTKIQKLRSLIENYVNSQNKIKKLQEIVKLEQLVNKIINKIQKKGEIRRLHRLITTKLYNYTTKQKQLKETEEKVIKLEKQWHEKMPETCPLCNNKIK
ncbi:MAG: AAA family ATPase [bacterium]